MFTEFFYRKIVGSISLTIVAICICYAFSLSRVKCVDFYGRVYYLVSENTKIEASTEFVRWEGGAGYLLENEGVEHVALSVFLDKSSAEKVQKRLEESGEKIVLVAKGKEKLYFKGKEKRIAGKYVSALKLLKTYILLLEDCIAKLENGMTQERCKQILKTLEKQFAYLQVNYFDYKDFADACAQFKESLRCLSEDTVYLKDLRYLLCWQTEKYVKLCEAFSL